MGNKKMFGIMERWGKYEIDQFKLYGVCESKEVAERYLEQIREKHRRVCELAIRDDVFYGIIDGQKKDYTDLQDEFDAYVKQIHFSHLDPDEETWCIDDLGKFNEIIGWWQNDYFRNWCRDVKGLSDEVIEATITFNSEDGYDNIVYFIAETDLLS